MKFVSRFSAYKITMFGGLTVPVEIDDAGVRRTAMRNVQEMFQIEFTRDMCDSDAINAAYHSFNGKGAKREIGPNGLPVPVAAYPARVEGIMTMNGMDVMYEQSDPRALYSGYDTELAIPDSDTRDIVERFLLTNGSYGEAYIKVEREMMAPPWPNYELLRGGDTKKIKGKVLEDGYDPHYVIAYEGQRTGGPRESLIEDMHDVIAQLQTAEEDAVIASFVASGAGDNELP